MKNRYSKYLYLWLIISVIISFSCREEIISPKNKSGNVNEPYKSSNRNSYTFILNADNISQTVIDFPTITYSNSRIFISLSDYTSGSVEIVIATKAKQVLYRNKLAENNDGSFGVVEGIKPEVIEIYFNDFTGKLKLQLTGIL
jgi:hypothetical protein